MTQIDFLGKSKFAVVLSAVLVLASVLALVTIGLRAGIEFTSGIQLVIFYPAETDLATDAVRSHVNEILAAEGASGTNFSVQRVTADREGTQLTGKMITVQTTSDDLMDRLQEAFTRPAAGSGIPSPILTPGGSPDVSITRIEPMVTREITTRAWQARRTPAARSSGSNASVSASLVGERCSPGRTDTRHWPQSPWPPQSERRGIPCSPAASRTVFPSSASQTTPMGSNDKRRSGMGFDIPCLPYGATETKGCGRREKRGV